MPYNLAVQHRSQIIKGLRLIFHVMRKEAVEGKECSGTLRVNNGTNQLAVTLFLRPALTVICEAGNSMSDCAKFKYACSLCT